MKIDYFRRFRRETVTEQTGPAPSVWRRFWNQSLRKAWLPLVLITFFVQVIEHLGWFEHLQATIVDTLSRGLTHEVPKDILIVEITDENYKEFFGQRSPLNPDTVIQLIQSVEQLHPTVIGVDLDTRDVAWAEADLRRLEHLMPRIVWAGVPEEATTPEENPSDPGNPAPLRLLPVLGGHVDPKWPVAVGVVRFPTGPDGFVRAFHCSYPIETKSKPMPAFFHAVAHQGRADLVSPDLGEGDGENPYLKFSGDRFQFQKVQASEFIEIDAGSSAKKDRRLNQQSSGTSPQNDAGIEQKVQVSVVSELDQRRPDTNAQNDAPVNHRLQVNVVTKLNQPQPGTSQNDGRSNQMLQATKRVEPENQHPSTSGQNDARWHVQRKHIPAELASKIPNRIVLIGGVYGPARDEYLTPLGKMAGVELLANAVETEMHGGVRTLTWIVIPADILMGSLIVFIYFHLPGRPGAALLWSLLAIFTVPLLIGLTSFYRMTAFLNFAPIMFGMLVHQMYEGTKETVKLQGEVAAKERVIEKLKAALQEARQPGSNLQVTHPTAMASAAPSDPASVLRTTIVESGTEGLHVQDGQEPPRRRRGQAAGK